MDDIIKYLIAFPDEQPFELPVNSWEEARQEVKRNFTAYGEVKILQVVYRPVTITPHFIKTK